MKQVFLIFCEGETEGTYLDYLKQAYRSPIKIISKVEGGAISQHLIETRRKELKEIERIWRYPRFSIGETDLPSGYCDRESLLNAFYRSSLRSRKEII